MPGPPPAGLEIVGEAYEVTASSNVTTLTKPAVLSLHYDPEAGAFENLIIYRWNFGTSTWQNLGGILDTEHQEVSISTNELGLYALMGKPTASSNLSLQQGATGNPCNAVNIYLPVVVK